MTVAQLLNEHAVQYVLIGGYALSANNLVRATEDIDLLVADNPDNHRRWARALAALPDAATAALAAEENPFAGLVDATIRINDVFTIDIMTSACGVRYEDTAGHQLRIPVGTQLVPVLDLEGLAMTKRGIRPKDIADAQAIAVALRHAEAARVEPTDPEDQKTEDPER